MNVASRGVGFAILLTVALVAPLTAQEATVDPAAVEAAVEAPVDARATIDAGDDEADRTALRDLFARSEVREAARIGGIDLEEAEARLATLEGDQLHRAAQQARALDSRLDAQGEIRISTITLIIILLLVIIIILLA